MLGLYIKEINNLLNPTNGKSKPIVTAPEKTLDMIYLTLQAYVEGVTPDPIDTIIKSIINEIRDVRDIRV